VRCAVGRTGTNSQTVTIEAATVATVGVPGEGLILLSHLPQRRASLIQSRTVIPLTPDHSSINLTSPLSYKAAFSMERPGQRTFRRLYMTTRTFFTPFRLLTTDFADAPYSQKMKAVSSLIGSRSQRGKDRDVLFVSLDGWDDHAVSTPGIDLCHTDSGNEMIGT
jgi:hypothetical protein